MAKEERDYKSTDLSTFGSEKPDDKQLEILKLIYGEVNSNYRNLADIRFKLLGFVPAISIIAWATLYNEIDVNSIYNNIAGFIISFLGLRVSWGVRTYDKRNDELYNDLVSRGRKIEEELGVHTAIFKGRMKANKVDIFHRIINHGRSLHIIYSSVFTGWSLLMLWYLIHFIKLFLL
jgi:hypothetical protein